MEPQIWFKPGEITTLLFEFWLPKTMLKQKKTMVLHYGDQCARSTSSSSFSTITFNHHSSNVMVTTSPDFLQLPVKNSEWGIFIDDCFSSSIFDESDIRYIYLMSDSSKMELLKQSSIKMPHSEFFTGNCRKSGLVVTMTLLLWWLNVIVEKLLLEVDRAHWSP